MNKKDLIIMITDEIDGMKYSNTKSIKVNDEDGAYWILFDSTEFEHITPSELSGIAHAIIDVFNKNIPDTLLNIEIATQGIKMNDNYKVRIDQLEVFCNIMDNFGNFQYIGRTEVKSHKEEKKPEHKKPIPTRMPTANDPEKLLKFLGINQPINSIDDLRDDEDDEDDVPYNPYEQFENRYYEVTGKPYKGKKHKNDKNKSKKNQKNKKSFYGVSRVWKNSDNMKRSINRHGVIVASKKDVKSDEETIKQFLKDFFPGKKEWQKEFRKDLLERWMNMFTIQKKDLKKYEQEYRAKQHKKAVNNTTKNVLGIASSLFTKPIDRWTDPNR